jgi:putative phosphoribosyl transferase
MRFRNREEAAALLAQRLSHFRGAKPLVLGIPRGGVPMARLVAEALGGDLDVVLVRKIGAPGDPELAVGSVSESGDVVVTPGSGQLNLDSNYVKEEAELRLRTLRRRRERLSSFHRRVDPAGRIVVLVDDGVATGATMLAALTLVRRSGPKWLVAAAAVAAKDVVERIADVADDVVLLDTPDDLGAVSRHFAEFATVTDDEVIATLREFRARRGAGTAPAAGRRAERRVDVEIAADEVRLEGALVVPDAARGIVIFAHGSGSSRRSPRNTFVAGHLHRRGLATLLLDLLTEEEGVLRSKRFDIGLLTSRLEAATRWIARRRDVGALPIGYFGASTGAACALRAAAELEHRIGAVVSRGGRPDLAADALERVHAPTLLIVGGADDPLAGPNRRALARLSCEKRMEIVPGATHLFEEPGALEQVADLAASWFELHLAHGAPRALPTIA